MPPSLIGPLLELERIGRFLDSVYGLGGELERLPGENLNVAVVAGEERFVLKVAQQGQSVEDLEYEHALIEHLTRAAIGLGVPETVRARDGAKVTTFPAENGDRLPVRLTRHVPGRPWNEARGRTSELRHDLGRSMGEIDLALAGFERASATREHRWNLERASRLRASVGAVAESDRRAHLDEAFRIYRAGALPLLAGLRRSVIHGDANDENVLVDGDRVVGLLDFGDACENPVVCELAIACTYAMLRSEQPAAEGADVVAGYHEVIPLEDMELEALAPLVFGRLAQSLAIATDRRRETPEHETYFSTEAAGWDLLETLLEAGPRATRERLCSRVTAPSPPPPTVEKLVAARRRLGPSLSLSYSEPLVMLSGRGPYLLDADERPFLDLVNNVCHVGHCHPRVVAAGREQMARLNTNTRYLHPVIGDYAERLCATLPDGLEVCYFVNSGSEANELALRLARTATGRRGVLVVEGAYHGNTTSLVDASPYKFRGPGGSGEPEPWVGTVPMPDPYRGSFRSDGAGAAYAETVRAAMRVGEPPPGALLIESLLGCAGQIVPPPGYLAAAFDFVREAGGVAIADEVQVGFGRVGTHFWAFEEQGARPDVVVLGKPIGNGHPMGAVVTTREIADAFANGMEFFSTFGGNPVSCAIGMAVLDVIEDEGLQARAQEVGGCLRRGLERLAERHRAVGEVRGRGLFLGVELVRDRESLEPAANLASTVVERMRRRGFLLSTDGPLHNVLKIKPPMVIDREDAESFIRTLDEELGCDD